MTYTQKTWATGDTITAAALNNMEQGIADAASDIATLEDALESYISDIAALVGGDA